MCVLDKSVVLSFSREVFDEIWHTYEYFIGAWLETYSDKFVLTIKTQALVKTKKNNKQNSDVLAQLIKWESHPNYQTCGENDEKFDTFWVTLS